MLRVLLLLVALVVLFFPDVVLGGRTLSSSSTQWGVMGERPPYGYPETGDSTHPRVLKGGPDYNNYLADPLAPAAGLEPRAEKISRLLRSGQVPVWARNMGLGRPVIGSWGLKPLRLPVLLAPTPLVWDVFLLARLVVAGVFTYLLARRLGLRTLGATAAAISFAFTGYSMLFINMPHVDFAMMLPIVLLAVDRVVEAPSAGRVTVAAVAVALGLVSDNPRTTVIVGLMAAAFGAYRAVSLHRAEERRLVLRRLAVLGGTLVAGVGLTMWAVLPFLELTAGPGFAGESSGKIGAREAGLDSLPAGKAIAQVIPFFEGPPALGFGRQGTDVDSYVGMATLFLAVMAMASRAAMRRGGWFLVGATAVMWGKLYGLPLVNWIGGLPLLQDVKWDKYLPPAAALCVVLLAGIGVDGFVERRWRGRGVGLAAGGLAGALGLFVWMNRGLLGDLPRSHLVLQLFVVLAVLGAAVGIWLSARAGRVAPRFATGALIGLVVVELLFHTFPVKEDWLPPGLQPVLKRTQLQVIDRAVRHDPFTEPPFVAFLRRDRTPFRVFGLDRILSPNTASAFDLEDIRSFTPTMTARLTRYVRAFINPSLRGRFVGAPYVVEGSEEDPPRLSDNPMLDLLNVKYVLTAEGGSELLDEAQFTLVHEEAGVRVYRNRDVLPRAFLVHEAVAVPDVEAAVARMRAPGFDPSATAVVEGLPASVGRGLAGAGGGSVRVVRREDARIELDVHTDTPALLVLSDIYYPDWNATIDGHPAVVRPTDVALRSVAVGPGRHRVVFAYEPDTVAVGAAVSGVILLALLTATAWSAIRRRRRAGRVRR